jgi:multiple sugar transport system ATP-binding protein
VIGIRPEDVDDAAITRPEAGRTLVGTVELVEPLGSDLMVHMTTDAPPLRESEDLAELGKDTEGGGPVDLRSRVIARFNPRSQVRIGDQATMSLDVERLHFFDVRSGRAIWADQPADQTHDS